MDAGAGVLIAVQSMTRPDSSELHLIITKLLRPPPYVAKWRSDCCAKSLLELSSHVSRSHRALIMMHTAWRNAARRCSSARWRPVPATLCLNRGIPAMATQSMAGATTSAQASQSTVRSAAGLPTRDEVMAHLRSGEKFDLLVVGGGSTGAGAALDAAARGLKVRRHCNPCFATRAAHVSLLLVVARAFRCW